MIIQRVVKTRTINEKEFKRLKKIEPFATYRQDSKGLNFGLLFGMSAKTYSATRLETNWTFEQCEDFIDEHDLRDKKFEIAKFYKDADPKLWSYYTVSTYFRDTFFKAYKGLMTRINDRRDEGKEFGFVRSIHGAIRHTLPLMFEGKSDNKREIANFLNIAANTDIQNDEACRVMPAIVEFNNAMKKKGYKSRIIGTVHDSVDFYIYKPEIAKLYKEDLMPIFEKMEDWQSGIPLTVELTVVDLLKQGAHYKHGSDIEAILKENK